MRYSAPVFRSFFLPLLSILLIIFFSSHPASCQPTEPADLTHNFERETQPERQQPDEDERDAHRQEKQPPREPQQEEPPPIDRPGEKAKPDDDKNDRLKRTEQERQRKRDEALRLREERDQKTARQKEKLHQQRDRAKRIREQHQEKQESGRDLIAINLEVIKPAVHQNERIKLIATIVNKSDKHTTDVPVHFYLNNLPIDEKVLNMKPGETHETQIDVLMVQPGPHEVLVRVDPNNKINERTKSNNQQKRMVEVVASLEENKQTPGPKIAISGQKPPIVPVPGPVHQKMKNEPPPEVIKDLKKQPNLPIPDPSQTMDIVTTDLRVSVPATFGATTGGGDNVVVYVMNVGIKPAMKSFTVGIYRHEHAKPAHWNKFLAQYTVFVDPAKGGFPKKSIRTIKIPWNSGPEPGVNYVAVVDTKKTVDEGNQGGENNNVSNVFKYIIPNLSIISLVANPSWPAAKQWVSLKADVVGEDSWILHYDYLNAVNSVVNTNKTIAWSGTSQFPEEGLKLPPFFPNDSQTEKVRIRLQAQNTKTGQKVEKSVVVERGYPIDGTLTIVSHSYKWDPKSKKVTEVSLNLQASTTKLFRIDKSGNTDHGSLYISAAIYNNIYGQQKNSQSTKKVQSFPIVSQGVYSTFPQQGTKKLYAPAKEFYPNNGKVNFTVSYNPTCKGKVEGHVLMKWVAEKKYNYYDNYPSIGITLVYHNHKGYQAITRLIPVTEAFRHPKYE